MTWIARIGLLVTTLMLGVTSAPRDASAEAMIRTQAPCRATGQSYCVKFDIWVPTDVRTLDFRSFSFTAPSAGTAQVSFNGSMYCFLQQTTFIPQSFIGVVDVVTQIVESATAVPAPDAPGALRNAFVLVSSGNSGGGLAYSTSDTFNLASTRVFTFSAAGTKTFRFRMRPLRIDPRVSCIVYNAAFTVVFAP